MHSVAARDAVDKKAGVYEAVNKPWEPWQGNSMAYLDPSHPFPRSRSKFYIGMHNEILGNVLGYLNSGFSKAVLNFMVDILMAFFLGSM